MKERKDKLILYYDGACSLCCRKMQWLANKDKNQRLVFHNIKAVDFTDSTVESLGISRFELNSSLHLRTADGKYFKDLDAIHKAYSAVGLGWITFPSRIIGIRHISDYLFKKWKQKVRGVTKE